MKKKSNFLDIPCELDTGTHKYKGIILQLTLTGLMVELDKILFPAGTKLTIHIDSENRHLNVSEEVRSIKNYDNFFRKEWTAAQIKKQGVDPKSLAELHFVKLEDRSYLKLKKYLDALSLGQAL